MADIKFIEEGAAGTITVRLQASGALPLDHPHVGTFRSALMALHRTTPILSLHFWHKPTAPGLDYAYEFDSVDGRHWNQVIHFASSSDLRPRLDWTASLNWYLDEVEVHRDVRRAVIALFVSYGLFDAKFTFVPSP